MKIPLWLSMLFLLSLLVSCAAGKNSRSEPPLPRPVMAIHAGDFSQTGIASWYGDDFHGKKTANGEIYDMRKLTAAHQTLPFHTMVEVENMDNGKKVVVRINDRGPFLKNRVIDLSLQAALRLEMTGLGTAVVNLRVLRWPGESLPAATAANPDAGAGCCIQFGAFAVKDNANDLLLSIADFFPELVLKVIAEDGMFKVISEKIPDADRCREVIRKMARYQLPGFLRKQ